MMPSVPAQTEGWSCTVWPFENQTHIFKIISRRGCTAFHTEKLNAEQVERFDAAAAWRKEWHR